MRSSSASTTGSRSGACTTRCRSTTASPPPAGCGTRPPTSASTPSASTSGGASAGGNLATATVLRLRDEDGWQPASLVAVYPVLHPELPVPSAEVAEALDQVPPVLRFTPEATAGINANYLGGPPSLADGYSFPALADVTGLCPTLLVVAEYDDLRTTGEAFGDQLAAAGVDVRRVLAEGVLHGFLNLSADVEPVDRILAMMATTVAHPTTVPAT